MKKIDFKALPDKSTPVNPANLNTMQNNIEEAIQSLYPIGSIYMSTNDINPNTLFSFGTWELWGQGRVPVGVDTTQTEFNTVEKTGGEKTHKLTIDEMPSHNHTGLNWASTPITITGIPGNTDVLDLSFASKKLSDGDQNKISTKNSGNSQPHNNLQPYITCYMWKRTA